jgi:hypothetical protein
MARKAFLVSFSFRTRVIVDVDNEDDIQTVKFDEAVSIARDQIQDSIADYLSGDNVDEIILDEELPYLQPFDI